LQIDIDPGVDLENEVVEPTDEQLASISQITKLQLAAEQEVIRLEREFNDAEGRLSAITKSLAEALEAAGTRDYTLLDGTKVKRVTEYHASISKPKAAAAFAWLRLRGHDGLIKNQAVLSFGKGEDEKALSVMAWAVGQGYDAKQIEKVEPQTLKAFVREQIEAGVDIPFDVFGIFPEKKAKVTPGKKK
jgi:hypothetical protein